MAEVWRTVRPDWLVWIASRPGVLSDEDLHRFGTWCAQDAWQSIDRGRFISLTKPTDIDVIDELLLYRLRTPAAPDPYGASNCQWGSGVQDIARRIERGLWRSALGVWSRINAAQVSEANAVLAVMEVIDVQSLRATAWCVGLAHARTPTSSGRDGQARFLRSLRNPFEE